MDSLVQKAWEIYQVMARFPVETILEAALWLEELYRKAPNTNVATAIAFHYSLLALREDTTLDSKSAQEYCARAARWQVVATECRGVSLLEAVTRQS